MDVLLLCKMWGYGLILVGGGVGGTIYFASGVCRVAESESFDSFQRRIDWYPIKAWFL